MALPLLLGQVPMQTLRNETRKGRAKKDEDGKQRLWRPRPEKQERRRRAIRFCTYVLKFYNITGFEFLVSVDRSSFSGLHVDNTQLLFANICIALTRGRSDHSMLALTSKPVLDLTNLPILRNKLKLFLPPAKSGYVTNRPIQE